MTHQPASGVLQERMQKEAHVAGLRDFKTPSLETVERRRVQLWVVALTVLTLITAGMALVSFFPDLTVATAWLPGWIPRVGMMIVAIGFCCYAVEKEVHLRRLTGLLIDERVLTAALSNRLKELTTLSTAGKAINSALSLDKVLQIILSSAMELLGGSGGAIHLLRGSALEPVCTDGSADGTERLRLGEGLPGRAAATGEPLLGTGGPEVGADGLKCSAICVPLLNRGSVLGVLDLRAQADRSFTEYDVRALTLFAEHAAISIANAHLYEEAERLAGTDALTGVANRRSFEAAFVHDVDRAHSRGTALSVTMVDVDRFKSLNDTAGHLAGDRALRTVASAMMEVVRSNDLIARFGGDEFVIVHPNCSEDHAGVLAQRIRSAAARALAELGAAISLSIGVASLEAEEGAHALLARADQALYQAKSGGGDQVVIAAASSRPALTVAGQP